LGDYLINLAFILIQSFAVVESEN